MSKLIDSLNPEQREAVTTVAGPVLVLAGAGSGKTRVIIHRIAWLLAGGVPAERILAVTFTNKAANEMRERIRTLVSRERCQGLTISTFHSFGLSLIRRYRHLMQLRGAGTILDESDRDAIIRQVRLEMGMTDKELSLEECEEFLMQVKGCGQPPEDHAGQFGPRKKLLLLAFFDQYTRRLRLAESLDFDDLILLPVTFLEGHPEVCAECRSLFSHIMVDEYQDTNMLQFRLLKCLVGAENNICVVGDDDQSIYGWRGARIENILEFDRHFPAARVIKLTRNYRSERNILQLANAVISRNVQRRAKELWTEAHNEVPALRRTYETAEEEAADIARRVKALAQGGIARREIAVLYRTKGQSRYLQEAFRLAAIPYRVIGSFDFFERKEIRDLLAYLRLACNPHDQVAFRRVVNSPPRGIGLTTLERMEALRGRERSLFQAARELLETRDPPLAARTARSLTDFLALVTRNHRDHESWRGLELPAAMARLFEESGLSDELVLKGSGPVKAVSLLIAMARKGVESGQCDSLPDFLERIALDRREADSGSREDDEVPDQVTLMTIHSAKGLEFHAVFLVGLVEGLFPHFRSSQEPNGLEEERRLFYVALTRARKHLFLSTFRLREERGESRLARPSRFFDELPAELLTNATNSNSPFLSKSELLDALDDIEL